MPTLPPRPVRTTTPPSAASGPATRTPLARRRRAGARLALYSSLALVVAGAAGFLAWLTPSAWSDGATNWTETDFAALPEVQLLQEYIAIDTSVDGDQLAGALWVAEQLSAMGLEPVIDRVGDEANVWAILEGQRREAVVLHHHIDVDPVPNPMDWRYLPFRGVIDGPWLYGRGAFDMKSVAVAQLEALRALVTSGERPVPSVIFLATTGEEVGSDFGTRWLLRRHSDLVERFEVVLTEGGAVEAISPERVKYWGTEVAQVKLLRVTICAGSRGALIELQRDLLSLGMESEPRLVPEIEEVLAAYAPHRHGRQVELLSDPRALVADPVSFRALPPYVRAFFVDLAIPEGVHPAPGGGHELQLSLLLLPGTDPQEAVARLLPSWLVHGFPVRVFDDGGAVHGTSPDHWAFRAVDRAVREQYPAAVHGPLYLPRTATDARHLRTAGVPTFGFSPFLVLTPEVGSIRRRATVNERIGLPGFVGGVELYRRVLAALASDTDWQPK
ncbi:MAG TPA: M20/M25/M40 family metallo-hydrolase [Thermoanaerobaculia bacterium]|nr:M20/M25/M40 family metallo-hydrolase [Thermoanaerobaculia bacterium]